MYNHFFDLSLTNVQNYLPVANSFGNDDFARFASSLESSPLGWLFNLPVLFKFAPSWREFYEQYLSVSVDDPVAFDQFIHLWVARQAVPYYDVVISRGGIFVTDAEGVAPASTARVERLLNSLSNDIASCVQRMHKTLLKATIDGKIDLTPMGCRIKKYMIDFTRNLMCRNVGGVTTNTLYYLEHYERLLLFEEYLSEHFLGAVVLMRLITWANTPAEKLDYLKQDALASIQRVSAELYLETVVTPQPDPRTLQRLENLLCDTLRRTADVIEYDKTRDIAKLFVCRTPHQGNNFFV